MKELIEEWKIELQTFGISLIVSAVYAIIFFYVFLKPQWSGGVSPAPLAFLCLTSFFLFLVLFFVLLVLLYFLKKRKSKNQ